MTPAPEHTPFRDTVRAFVAAQIAPHVNAWDEAESFPRTLCQRIAHIGLLGLAYPEAYGGAEEAMKELAARQLGV
jgi:acyl-CoA dehydrogenase